MARLLAALILFTGIACACDCPPTPTCGALSSEAQYFVGAVVMQRNVPHQGAGKVDFVDYTVRVSETFAPNIAVGSTTHVWSDPSSGCSWTFKLGDTYLFETHRDGNRLYTSLCTFTADLINAQPVLTQLRAIKAGHRLPSLVGTLLEDGVQTRSSRRPIGQVVVTALSATGQRYTAKTDAQGTFLFDALPASSYTLTSELPVGTKLFRGVAAAEDPTRIKIPAGATGVEASCRAYLDATRR